MGVGGQCWLSVCPRAWGVWQGSHGVGGRGQAVSVAQRLDRPSASPARCGRHRLAEGRRPAGKTWTLALLAGAVSEVGKAVWQGVNGHHKLVVCHQGQVMEPSWPFEMQLHCLLFVGCCGFVCTRDTFSS